ncbi:MAG: 4'-phosphopantetheinyl transferase superfamily protein [Gammaproteobacteria bacterium]|nr:4'-phosphopantetheinyl transferase superfamily protein [Gammaproteobacteria bacterium]
MNLIREWTPPPPNLTVPDAGYLDLWLIDLTQETVLSHPFLSPDEKERVRRIQYKAGKRRFSNARTTMRKVLSDYLGMQPWEIRFAYGAMGKPEVALSDTGIRFNLSHSEDLAILVVTDQGEVGIDLEPIRQRKNLLGIAKRVFDESTFKYLSCLPNISQMQEFNRLWTELEARSKAAGKGVFHRPEGTGIDILSFEPKEEWVATIALMGDLPGIDSWHCHHFVYSAQG